MGGLAAEAMGGDFKTGAVAAGANELLVDRLASQYDAMLPGEKGRLLTMNSQLIGVLAAELSGGDAEDLQIGSQVAASATQYNYLRHEQINDYVEELDGCEARGDCTAIEQKYQALSDAQQESLIALCETDLDACAAQYESVFGDGEAMQAALDRLKGSGREAIPFSASDDAWVLHEQNEAISNRYLFALTKHELEQTTDLSGEDLTRLAMVMTALGGPRRGASKSLDGNTSAQQSGETTNRARNVVEGEIGPYGDLAQRSVRDGMTPDHIPSFAAVRENLRNNGVDVDSLSDADVRALRSNTNCVVVRTCDHQTFSRTYGGRNNQAQIQFDAQDLRRAADADLDAWEPVWRKNGWSETDIVNARRQVHEYNRHTFEELGVDYGSD